MAGPGTKPRRRLSDTEVRRVRKRFAAGAISQRQLAIELGVSAYYMHQLLTGRVRQEAGGPVHAPRHRRILTAEEARAAREEFARGVSRADLANRYGVTLSSICRLLQGESHREAC